MIKVNTFLFVFLLCIFASCTSNIETSISEAVNSSSLYGIRVADKCGYIDEKGNILIEPQFDYADRYFTEGTAYAELGEKHGLIDSTGNFSIVFVDTVEVVKDFEKGLAVVECKNGEGIINKKGKLLLWKEGDLRLNFDGNDIFVCVRSYDNGWKSYITDLNGTVIGVVSDDPNHYICYHDFHDGLCCVKKNNKYGFMNNKGELVIDTIYDDAGDFSNGLCWVKKHSKYGFVNNKGELIIDTLYDDARNYGMCEVKTGGSWYSFDNSGVLNYLCDSIISDFHCNRASVWINGKKWLIDSKGKKICQIDADEIDWFDKRDHLATIIKDHKASKIDTMGNVVLATNFIDIGTFEGGVAPFWDEEGEGFVDSIGNVIIRTTKEQSYDLHEKRFKLRAFRTSINGFSCWTYYDKNGTLIWKDMPSGKKSLPWKPEKKDFVEYYDSRMSELDPIEGIFYVTINDYYQDRENPTAVGTNGSRSKFYAITKDKENDGYKAYCIDGSNQTWVNKFVRIGESDDYAITKVDKDNDYSSEGRMTLSDPTHFEFRLERGHNTWYNFFVTYEFVRDYPPMEEFEKVQKVEWTGTGFAISDGYIVTNYHVATGAKTIRVKGINGDMKKTFKGFVVAADKEHDLSIIKIVDKEYQSMGSIPYSIGKTTVDVGDEVFVLGYPMTKSMGEEIKLTNGIISAASGYKGDESMYQISAAVQPGNSGGPLFNSDGTIIGIINAKHADAENVNYAVKVSYLYSLITSSDLG
ncbi:MAG: WG repeat-containing protein, partial [Alphaproteobacteria bacterium]|nr:WG repeat-containing protein [Alphaproteobacteria bacterium]